LTWRAFGWEKEVDVLGNPSFQSDPPLLAVRWNRLHRLSIAIDGTNSCWSTAGLGAEMKSTTADGRFFIIRSSAVFDGRDFRRLRTWYPCGLVYEQTQHSPS
jgi:hypothetical protein